MQAFDEAAKARRAGSGGQTVSWKGSGTTTPKAARACD